jgi:hypothetical protein
MSKAISGAVMIAADLAIGAALFLNPALLAVFNPATINILNGVIIGLFAGGVSMEAGALADALTSNRGQNISTRQAAGLRQIIYGTQRVGGVVIYQSTTGVGGSGGNFVYNYIIAVATHSIDAFVNVFLDGRQVFWKQDGNTANVGCGSVATPATTVVTISGGAVTAIAVTAPGSGYANVKPTRQRVRIYGGGGSGAAAYATNSGTPSSPVFTVHVTSGGSGYTTAPTAEIQGLYVFGGVGAADTQDPTQIGFGSGYGIGPSGAHYNFSGKVFCEARFGDQIPSDYMASLSANDSVWPSTANVSGVAYLYLNVGFDTNLFTNPPEIRITVNGKDTIYDPRSGATGFSTNWALQVADVITDPTFGLGDAGSVNTAQLIAAANVCDQLILTSQGNEPQYPQNIHFDSSTAPGDQLSLMMPSAQGRLSRIGGQWFIWPAYWQGPSYSFDSSVLIDAPTWTPNRSFKDLFNRVNGTYIAPNYPYATSGNLYDANGWYYGTRSNVWPFAWQPTNFPQYAADVRHGYTSDLYLAEDGGVQLPKELGLRGVISITQAQRLAKICLMRNRFQGSGSFPMALAAWAQMQPTDVFNFTWAALGWSSKVLEVDSIHFVVEPVKNRAGGEDDQTPAITATITAIETDPTIYEWSIAEELTPYDVPAAASQIPSSPAAPTLFTVTSSAATAIVGADGIVTPRALLSWNAPLDISVTQIEIQYQLAGAPAWLAAGMVAVGLFEHYVSGVIAGQTYNFQIRSVRPSGNTSGWVTALGEVISITLSTTISGDPPVAPPGTLSAVVDGTGADIIVWPFTASVGGLSVACLPSGAATITALVQGQLYYVYYADPTFAGGAITPVATQNLGDFVGVIGRFYIGSITTPTSGSSALQRPNTYADSGTRATSNPTYAYDGNPSTYALLDAQNTTLAGQTNADCVFSGFVPYVTTAVMTLSVTADLTVPAASNASTITATIGGASTTMLSTAVTTASATYTATVPIGTNLNSISVEVITGPQLATSGGSRVLLKVYDINVH